MTGLARKSQSSYNLAPPALASPARATPETLGPVDKNLPPPYPVKPDLDPFSTILRANPDKTFGPDIHNDLPHTRKMLQ